MCGIAIIIDSAQSGITDHIIDLTAAIRHRGPDDEGITTVSASSGKVNCWAGPDTNPDSLTDRLNYTPTRNFDSQESNLNLGHRRLSILDLTPSGHQPIGSQDGRYWISYNGEVYNHRELREELQVKGYTFQSHTDTETLLAAYDCWGKDMLDRLIGMFAFGLFDSKNKTVFIARDFFGIKPLYYWQGKDGIAFASEIKALLRLPQVSRKVNPQRLYQYLLNGVTDFGDETLFRDIKQLPAAHWIEIDLNSSSAAIKPKRYWSVETSLDPEAKSLSFDQAADRLRHLFLESVSLHLRSDVPVGAALSGGIDSSSIFMAMRHLQGKNIDLHGFSFIPSDDSISEEKWVDLVISAAGAKVHKVRVSSGELLSDVDTLIRCQDEPFGSTSMYAQHRVFRLAHENGIKVMLDGQGADEILGGYTSYFGSRIASLIRSGRWIDAITLSKAINKNPQVGLKTGAMYLGKTLLPTSLHKTARALVGKSLVPDWLNENWFTQRNVVMEARHVPAGKEALKSLLKETLVETSLPGLLRYEDRNSMAHSIESRVPFLTPKLVGFLYNLPEEYLIDRTGVTKAVFRKAMRGIVPDTILDRKDKIGFNTPEKLWLTELSGWVDKILQSPYAASVPALKIDVIQTRWRSMRDGSIPFDFRLWRWVNLIRWAELTGVEF